MRKILAIVRIVSSAAVILTIGALHYLEGRSAVRLQKAQNLLEKDIESHLRPGSPLASVEEFLNQRLMRHTDLEHVGDAQAVYYGSENILEARSADTDTGFYLKGCSFWVVFRFDKNGALQGFTAKPSCKAIWWENL